MITIIIAINIRSYGVWDSRCEGTGFQSRRIYSSHTDAKDKELEITESNEFVENVKNNETTRAFTHINSKHTYTGTINNNTTT